jgi:hypothetical protein
VLYIDVDDDLAILLDRVEEAGTPAIVVLPEGARSVRGMVAARLLQRRAEAGGIDLVAVTTDRTAIAQLNAVRIRAAPTVGAARTLLAPDLPQPGIAPGLPPPVDAPSSGPDDPVAALDWEEASQSPDGALDDDALAALLAQQFDPVLEDSTTDEQAVGGQIPRPRRTGGGYIQPAAGAGGKPELTRVRRALLLAGALAALLVIGLFVWAFFLPSAALTITYRRGVLDTHFTVPIGSGAQAIPMHRGHISQTMSVDVPGTGTQLVPDQRAHGLITFANPQAVVENVPAGTIVTARSGARFMTLQTIQIPAAVNAFAGTTNGQQSVAAQATAGGDQGNVPAGSIVGIVGQLGNLLLITNQAAMTGGTMRTLYYLTAQDLSAPPVTLHRALLGQETAALNARYARSPVKRLGPFTTDPPVISRFERGGRPYAHIALTMHGSAMYVHAADVDRVVQAKLLALVNGKNERLVPGSVIQQIIAVPATGGSAIRVQVQARTAPNIDVADLQERLAGLTVDQAIALLQQGAANGGWTYALSTNPDWVHRMPQVRSLITVHVVQLG